MPSDLLALALTAGLLAALNPCGFALLPAYLALVVNDAGTVVGRAERAAAVGRALVATIAMTLGFLTVFAVFGTLTVAVAGTVQRYLPVLTVLIGLTLVVVGIWLLAGRELHVRLPAALTRRTASAPTARLGSMFGYGVAYAVASLGCTVGPFLAVTAASARSSTLPGRVAVYLAYAGGFALIVGTLAVAAAFTTVTVADRLRKLLPIITRIGGLLVLVVGLYVGYYGIYELRLFHTDADPNDGIIAAAARLQGRLAGWVHGGGALPWLLALAGLGAATLIGGWLRGRRGPPTRRDGPAPAKGDPGPVN